MTKPEYDFKKQINGYNTKEVDEYISTITKAYQNLYKKYKELEEREKVSSSSK